ncbi:glycosyltransferase [Rhodanobacter sp. MP7CTX1]|uniref:glycosyltransferase n=1 Tax=Rhodanobacter sp. MP7CTX1 TaxID=2723084 RepID=UPI00161A7448|nr:glycosyltransferase [Rhodanobacter sp. MP7CTX1]MBB6186543.1 GT2 family glycosyltransferase [Rhodanobacter sp. MP7CTX1]
MTPASIFAVTVTYGQRRSLLEQMLVATLAEGIRDIVIVDNGAGWDVGELVSQYPDASLHLVSMGSNQGSAAGFAGGIGAAMQAGAEMIWLLDDDNRPLTGALHALLEVYAVLLAHGGTKQDTAVLAFRPEHQADVAMGVPQARINPRRSSFLGFHVLDIPYKLWRRTPWGKPQARHGLPAMVKLDIAPYSGLLLHREAVEAIGLPRTDFVLYADDSEWSFRITRRGGRIVLVTTAHIEDLESSWNIKRRFGTSFSGLLCGPGDSRAFYSTRNAAFLCTHCQPSNWPLRAINRTTYLALLWFLAWAKGRHGRYRLLNQAVSDGVAGRLGLHSEYPL